MKGRTVGLLALALLLSPDLPAQDVGVRVRYESRDDRRDGGWRDGGWRDDRGRRDDRGWRDDRDWRDDRGWRDGRYELRDGWRDLPPGLRKQLRRGRGLPPGWSRRGEPVPVIILDRMPRRRGVDRFILDGRIYTVDRRSGNLLDIAVIWRR